MLPTICERPPRRAVLILDDFEEPIVPIRIGFCSNPTGAFEFCMDPILDNDYEAIELPMKNQRRQFICGPCVSRLLQPKPVIEEPDKGRPREKQSKRTGARLPMGEDLKGK